MGRRTALLCFAGLLGCGVPTPPDIPALEAQSRAGDSAAVERLVDLLGGDQPSEARTAAYQALLSVGAAVGREVIEACRDRDPLRREQALALAGNLKLAGAYEVAVSALDDLSFPRRYVAAWALGQLGEARGTGPLIRALERERGETAREAARALFKLGSPSAKALLAALPRLQGEARGHAIRLLGDLRDPAALPALEAALVDPGARPDAVWALGTLDRPEAAGAILPYLKDPEWRVRLEACRALGLLTAADAERPLEELRATDPVPAVREWAARSLSLLRGRPQKYANARGDMVEPENLYR